VAAVKVLAAGASGFVGRRLCPALAKAGHDVVAMTRNPLLSYPQVVMVGWLALIGPVTTVDRTAVAWSSIPGQPSLPGGMRGW
jgi:nucleoside-diphosphate-sugar epimerase